MQVLKDAFSGLLHNKLSMAALVVLPIICGIFSMFYVNSFLDPVEQMRSLPIAVINEDSGAVSNNERFNLGDEIVDSLTSSSTAKWIVEDEDLLESGLESTDYFMALVIPEGFSEQVMAGATDDPKVADLVYWRNERKNYTLSQLSTKIEVELKESVQAMVVEQYTEALAQGLLDAEDGMVQAANGAGDLSDGIETLSQGLGSAAGGAALLDDGALQLEQNSGLLAQGSTSLSQGIQSLDERANQLPAGVVSLDGGAQALSAGVSAAVAGTGMLQTSSTQLTNGITALGAQLSLASSASNSICSGLDSAYNAIGSASTVGTLQYAVAGANTCVEMAQLAEGNGGMYGGRTTSEWLAQATAALSEASIGLSYLQSSIGTAGTDNTIANGAMQLQMGLDSALSVIGSSQTPGQTLAYGAAQLEGGITTLNSELATMETGAGSLARGTSQLASSTDELLQGTRQLADATGTLENGAGLLALGATQLSDNTAVLAEGITEASEGAGELFDGSSTLTVELRNGAADLEVAVPKNASSFSTYLGDPVVVTEDTYGDINYFGLGFAPLFISLALWVGALMNSIVLNSFPSKKIKAGRVSVIFGRLPLYLLFGFAETLAVVVAMVIIGVPVFSWPLAVIFLLIISASFVAIIQMLSLAFGLPGKALVILLTILQLAGASGTLPVELSSDFLRSVSTWFPFTYAIDGIRELMSGSSVAVVMQNSLFLGFFFIGALILGLVLFPLGRKIEEQAQKRAVGEAECGNT